MNFDSGRSPGTRPFLLILEHFWYVKDGWDSFQGLVKSTRRCVFLSFNSSCSLVREIFWEVVWNFQSDNIRCVKELVFSEVVLILKFR